MATKKKVIRSTAKLTTLDDFLGEEGRRDEFEAIAVKEVLAWQIEQAMEETVTCHRSSWLQVLRKQTEKKIISSRARTSARQPTRPESAFARRLRPS